MDEYDHREQHDRDCERLVTQFRMTAAAERLLEAAAVARLATKRLREAVRDLIERTANGA